MLPGINNNPDFIRGRIPIADFLGIHPETLDRWRKRSKKNGDPIPILIPSGKELEASKTELTTWRSRQYEH